MRGATLAMGLLCIAAGAVATMATENPVWLVLLWILGFVTIAAGEMYGS